MKINVSYYDKISKTTSFPISNIKAVKEWLGAQISLNFINWFLYLVITEI